MEPASILMLMGGIFLFFLLIMSVVIVPEKSSKIIQRFGKFSRILPSGLSFRIPFIESVAGTINLKVQQLDVEVETKTLDNVFVDLRISVQYKVLPTKVWEAFYSLDDTYAQIASYVFDDVRSEVPKMNLDDVFSRKDDIAVAVANNLSAAMEEYGYIIVKTLITDINPDEHVKVSMNRINAAKRDRHAALEEAEGEKIKVVKAAEAEAESKRLQGEGIAKQRLEIIRGFKESVEDFQKSLDSISPEEVMQFVLMTQYFDTLNSVGANSRSNTILIPHSPGAMKDFQEQIIQGTLIGSRLNDGANAPNPPASPKK